MTQKDKKTLIREFETMKEIENSASKFYYEISQNPEVKNKEIKEVFEGISKEEIVHNKIVQRIINIIKNNL